MKKNKHGFEPKQEFTMGGIAWTVIQTGANWVKCITSDCIEKRAFDKGKQRLFGRCVEVLLRVQRQHWRSPALRSEI